MNTKILKLTAVALSLVTASPLLLAQEDKKSAPEVLKISDVEKAWVNLQSATQPPEPPSDWKTNRPSAEQVKVWNLQNSGRAAQVADLAAEFLKKYPTDSRTNDALQIEEKFVILAVNMGNTNLTSRLEAMEKRKEADPSLSEDERFDLEVERLNRRSMAKQPEGIKVVLDELEKGVRELQKKYPKNPQIFRLIMNIASNAEGDQKRRLLEEVAQGNAPAQVKTAAEGQLKLMNSVGKPIDIAFKAIDGREVDLKKMQGKVVLIDFWATWCGPCIAELPKVKEVYNKFNPKGFEIVGISLDQDKEPLEELVKKQKMAWPQYFSEDADNKFAERFAISAIPTMWLVDKKGNLRELNAREDLEGKVEKLLAE